MEAAAAAAAAGGPSSSSSSTSQLLHHHEEDEDEEEEDNDPTISQRLYAYFTSSFKHDLCSFLIVCFTLWFFVSMTIIFGFYGSEELPLGPYISCPVQANSLLVQSIKLKKMGGPKHGVILFEFSKPPPLEVEINWSEARNVFVQSRDHKEWPYFLNEGSKVDIIYRVNSPVYAPLSLVIAQGKEKLSTWGEDPSHHSTTLSWNIIYGTGMIQQDIAESDIYYIAVGNLNLGEVEVYLNFSVKAYVYNTSDADNRCSLSYHECSLELSVLNENVAILTSPEPDQVEPCYNGYVVLSYNPRWITYFVGSGIVTTVLILASRIWGMFGRQYQTHVQALEPRSEQDPLLSRKDDDHSSCDSFYESITHEEEELDKLLAAGAPDGNNVDNLRSLCVVCFNASRDCFFLPCGHSATCFTCGQRVLADAGNCLICHRKTKKVRLIINV